MLKKLIVSVAVLFAFTGCITDNAYQVGKVFYMGGKAVVIANYDMLSDEQKADLKKIDDIATRYDITREMVKAIAE